MSLKRSALAALAVLLAASASAEWVYFGTFPNKPGQGIYVSDFDPKTGALSPPRLAAELGSPNFLTINPASAILYALGNHGWGKPVLDSFSIDRATGTLKLLNEVPSSGPGDTYLSLSRDRKTLFSADYGDGTVAAYRLLPSGEIGARTGFAQQSGTGVVAQQSSPHAHCIDPDPSGRFVLSADLGADKLYVYRFDSATGALSPSVAPWVPLPAGSGPRHLVFGRDGRTVYVISELAATVTAYSYHEGTLTLLQTISTVPPDFTGRRWAAEVAVTPSGRFLYASNRADDESIAVFAITKDGRLTFVQRFHTADIHQPRHFEFDSSGRWLLCASADGDNVIVVAVDPATGRLTPTDQFITVPRPVCIAQLR